MRTSRHNAFSLLEIIIMVSILSILAALVVPRITAAQGVAEAVSAGTSMKAIADAAHHHRATTGDWPSDRNRRVIPPELIDYLPHTDFTAAPLGGVWDFEDWTNSNYTAGGDPVAIAISIVEGDETLYEAVDAEIDDGNLTTGAVRYCESKPRLLYVLQFK